MTDSLRFTDLFFPSSVKIKISSVTKNHILLKVTSVALAALAFFTLQYGYTLAQAGVIAGTLSSLTWLSEIFLRQDRSFRCKTPNWYNTKSLDRKVMIEFLVTVLCVNVIYGMAFSYFNISIGQHVQELIKKGSLRILLIAIVVAPISEEILFRGFLQERLEDGCYLFSRFITPLSSKCVKRVSNISQAIIFGLSHVNERQTPLANALILASTTLMGYGFGGIKNLEASLFSSIFTHMSINTSVTARLLVFNH